MSMNRFTNLPYSGYDKRIEILDTENMVSIWIDYDDVDHDKVDKMLPELLFVLNHLIQPSTQPEELKADGTQIISCYMCRRSFHLPNGAWHNGFYELHRHTSTFGSMDTCVGSYRVVPVTTLS